MVPTKTFALLFFVVLQVSAAPISRRLGSFELAPAADPNVITARAVTIFMRNMASTKGESETSMITPAKADVSMDSEQNEEESLSTSSDQDGKSGDETLNNPEVSTDDVENSDSADETLGSAEESTTSSGEQDSPSKDDASKSEEDTEGTDSNSSETKDKSQDDTSGKDQATSDPQSVECSLNKLSVTSGVTELKLTLRDLVPLVQSDKVGQGNVQDALDSINLSSETLSNLALSAAAGKGAPKDLVDTLLGSFKDAGKSINALKSGEESVATVIKQAQGEILGIQNGADAVVKTCGV